MIAALTLLLAAAPTESSKDGWIIFLTLGIFVTWATMKSRQEEQWKNQQFAVHCERSQREKVERELAECKRTLNELTPPSNN
ncbi:hypothetical protein [Schlesneria paludicola]|uniref:hypothetical protein n=1 Tax=Schlesneria paludicola TaxID=360056 RepID=UPI00029A600D|nr:hypothetical protein [Schlesneria paludicola]